MGAVATAGIVPVAAASGVADAAVGTTVGAACACAGVRTTALVRARRSAGPADRGLRVDVAAGAAAEDAAGALVLGWRDTAAGCCEQRRSDSGRTMIITATATATTKRSAVQRLKKFPDTAHTVRSGHRPG